MYIGIIAYDIGWPIGDDFKPGIEVARRMPRKRYWAIGYDVIIAGFSEPGRYEES